MAIGTDIGTMFLVKGEIDPIDEGVSFELERNVFAEVREGLEDPEEILKNNGYSYAKLGEKIFVIGEDVFKIHEIESLFKKSGAHSYFSEVRRPMQNGLLNTSDDKMSIAIIQEIVKKLIGKPSEDGEVLCFCAPGDPINSKNNVLFHKMMLTNFVKSLGYIPECINEALAIVYSECPTAEDSREPDGIAKFSGIGISMGAGMINASCVWKQLPLLSFSIEHCIPPGNKVFTKFGLKNIENIKEGDFVLNKDGKWVKVIKISSKEYDGKIYNFNSYGMGSWSTTHDHKIFVKRSGEWMWLEAKDVAKTDFIKQPWPEYNEFEHSLSWTDAITGEYKTTPMQSKQCYLIGRFLGDGSIFRSQDKDRGIRIYCNHSDRRINYVQQIMKSIFKTNIKKINRENENIFEIKIHNMGVAKWFRSNCYDENKIKKFPWDISDFKENYLRFLLAGLMDSDGYIDKRKGKLLFTNTSPSVAQTAYFCMLKLGMKPVIRWRKRSGGHIFKDKMIRSTKECFEVYCGGNRCREFIGWLYKDKLDLFQDNSQIGGFNSSTINEIDEYEYNGLVYDLSVDDDTHSFCLTGCVVHNCGDWIDQESARIAGCDVASITKFKEKHLDLSSIDQSDIKQLALDVYYTAMIENTMKQFASKFEKLDNRIDTALDIVIAGGTASVPGFVEKFKQVLSTLDLPFKIKEIKLAQNPLYAVCNGCLIKAISVENKLKNKAPIKDNAPKKMKIKDIQ